MNKKLVIGIGILFSLVLFSSMTIGIEKNVDDPINDVIVPKDFSYTFDLEKSSIEDLEIIDSIEYYHISEKEGLDLIEVDIDTEGKDTLITFEVRQAIEEYPYYGRNTFFIGIILLENEHEGVGAVHVEQSVIELNKYGKYLGGELSTIQDFTYSHDEDEFVFIIPSEDCPDTINHIYAVVGEADIEDLDIDNVKFTISNIRIDLYPNSLYGAEDEDYPENEDVDDDISISSDSDTEEINYYLIGTIGLIAILSILVIPNLLNKKS